MQASSFGLCQMACVFKVGIIPQFHRPGNLKGVASFNILTEFGRAYVGVKVQPHQPSVLNRLCKSNVKVYRIF